MLTDDVVRQLANGDGAVYHFDFSKIASEFYEPLLRTLQHFAIRKIDSLGFTCDELSRAEQRVATGRQVPIAVLNSIAKTKSHFMRNVVELICFVLPRSTRILELTLSNLTVRKDYWERIVNAMSHSTSLESVNLSKVRVGVEGIRLMMKELDPNHIRSISISYCGASEENLNDILAFIKRKDPGFAKNGGIQVFQISKAEISEEQQRKIQEALGNKEPSPIKKVPFRPLSPKNIKRPSEEKELAEITALERENEELRAELARIRAEINAVEYNEDVYIVGKDAEELVKFIAGMEDKIKELEQLKQSHRGRF